MAELAGEVSELERLREELECSKAEAQLLRQKNQQLTNKVVRSDLIGLMI